MKKTLELTEYENPWRPNYELKAACWWGAGALGYAAYAGIGSFPAGPLLWMAAGCAAMGTRMAIPGFRLMKTQLRLVGHPLATATFEDLKKLCSDPAHRSDMWLGRGFLWQPRHTQKIYDILRINYQETEEAVLGSARKWLYLKKHPELILHPVEAHRRFEEESKSIQKKGQSWIHGVGEEETDLFQPLSHSEGHTLIIGTTGAGKAQPLTARILTPTGWTTMGKIRPGQFVLNWRGEPVMVEKVFDRGLLKPYAVTTTDGRRTTACAEHLWTVWIDRPNEGEGLPRNGFSGPTYLEALLSEDVAVLSEHLKQNGYAEDFAPDFTGRSAAVLTTEMIRALLRAGWHVSVPAFSPGLMNWDTAEKNFEEAYLKIKPFDEACAEVTATSDAFWSGIESGTAPSVSDVFARWTMRMPLADDMIPLLKIFLYRIGSLHGSDGGKEEGGDYASTRAEIERDFRFEALLRLPIEGRRSLAVAFLKAIDGVRSAYEDPEWRLIPVRKGARDVLIEIFRAVGISADAACDQKGEAVTIRCVRENDPVLKLFGTYVLSEQEKRRNRRSLKIKKQNPDDRDGIENSDADPNPNPNPNEPDREKDYDKDPFAPSFVPDELPAFTGDILRKHGVSVDRIRIFSVDEVHGAGNGNEDADGGLVPMRCIKLSDRDPDSLYVTDDYIVTHNTRCFDLLISQAILRGESVIIIDPKGDNDLRQKAERACRELGRPDAFINFHPAKPQESVHINLLANWTRPTEIASRVANLLPSQGPSDPFKSFSWGALNTICGGLCLAYKKPTLLTLRHYLEGSPEKMMLEGFEAYIKQVYGEKEGEAIIRKRFEELRKDTLSARVSALVEEYQKNCPPNPEVDSLISLREHDKEHFSKMITSLLPTLMQLTSGTLGKMLSPSEDDLENMSEEFFDTGAFIDKNAVVYLGLDTLSDGMVGSAIGSLMLADLTSAAGSRYNFEGGGARTVNVFVDEAAEVVNDSFIQLLNKGRGAKIRLFVATQTIADFAARLGSKEKATQVLGNLNQSICLRCIDQDTQKYMSSRFPKTRVRSIAVDQAYSTDADNLTAEGGRVGERLTETESPLIMPEIFGMLPDLEYIASLSGGRCVKGRFPLLLKDASEIRR